MPTRDWVPDYDALVVQRLCGAGGHHGGQDDDARVRVFEPHGQPVVGYHAQSRGTPITRPADRRAGSAAAVVAECVPLAEGSDAGGSVRIPAAHSGCVGLKPSSGRIPFEFLPTQFDYMCCHGPLSRTVADAALFLKLCQGPDERDLNSLAPASVGGRSAAGGRSRHAPRALHRPWLLQGRRGCRGEHPRRSRCPGSRRGPRSSTSSLAGPGNSTTRGGPIGACSRATHFGHHLERWRNRMHPSVVASMEEALEMSAVELMKTETIYTEVVEQAAPHP